MPGLHSLPQAHQAGAAGMKRPPKPAPKKPKSELSDWLIRMATMPGVIVESELLKPEKGKQK